MSGIIKDFYRGKCVLLTGGTGFFGKMIIGKLLSCCDVEKIYLVVRSKKGQTPKERVEKLLEDPVFEKLIEMQDKHLLANKMHAFEGDLSKKRLGLAENDIKLINDKVNLIFHCGAFLNMDAKLHDAVITNVRGTAEIIKISNGMKDLQAFILVSTAYSHCKERIIEERFYKSPIDPTLLISMAEQLDRDFLNKLSTMLTESWPNSYVYSKAVAESLLLSDEIHFPVGLFRPAIVTSTVSEPVPGWSDNLYGPLGILLYSNAGLLRLVRADGKIKPHIVPGDMCINALLCVAWDINEKWKKMDQFPRVYNFSANRSKLLVPMNNFADFTKLEYIHFKAAMWYQVLFLVKTKYVYEILKFLVQTIPAYLIQPLLSLTGRKISMKKINAKLNKTASVLSYFLINEWDIDSNNVFEVWQKLTRDDRELFKFDLNSIETETYYTNLMNGLKKYTLKENMNEYRCRQQVNRRLIVLHYTVKNIIYGVTSYTLFKGIKKYLLLVHKKRTV